MSLKSRLFDFLEIEKEEIEKGLGDLAETIKTQVSKAKKHVDSEITRHNKAKELMACIILAGSIQTRAMRENPKVKILICLEAAGRDQIKGYVDYLSNVEGQSRDLIQRIPFNTPNSLIKAVNS
jgi:hypothetical protein